MFSQNLPHLSGCRDSPLPLGESLASGRDMFISTQRSMETPVLLNGQMLPLSLTQICMYPNTVPRDRVVYARVCAHRFVGLLQTRTTRVSHGLTQTAKLWELRSPLFSLRDNNVSVLSLSVCRSHRHLLLSISQQITLVLVGLAFVGYVPWWKEVRGSCCGWCISWIGPKAEWFYHHSLWRLDAPLLLLPSPQFLCLLAPSRRGQPRQKPTSTFPQMWAVRCWAYPRVTLSLCCSRGTTGG